MTEPPPSPKHLAAFMRDEVTDDRVRYQAGERLISWAQRLGVDVDRVESWGHLASQVSDRMGGKRVLCDSAATLLGFWTPVDPSLLGDELSWIGYIHCGDHSIDEVEARIAEKHARTS